MAENARHPDKLVEECVDAANEILIEQIAVFVEQSSDSPEVNIFKDRHQSELAHDRKQALNCARAAERAEHEEAAIDVVAQR